MKSIKIKSTQIILSGLLVVCLAAGLTENNYAGNNFFLGNIGNSLKLSSYIHPASAQSAGSLQIVGVEASTSDDNLPPNAIDNNLDTRWSGLGIGAWIKFDLGSEAMVNKVAIAFYRGTKREADFKIEVSTNGSSWNEVVEDTSSGETNSLQEFSFSATPARYVRIVGEGNEENDWNSLTEVVIYGTGGTSGGGGSTTPTNQPGATTLPPVTGLLIDETNDTIGWLGGTPLPTILATIRPTTTTTNRPSATATVRPTTNATATVRPTTATTTTPNQTQQPPVGGGIPTEPNLKVAFIGDTGAEQDFQDVLNLIKAEGAQVLVVPGDLAYSTNTAVIQTWHDRINNTLGANFPYFTSIGNHESSSMWTTSYVPSLTARMSANGAQVTGNVGASSYSAVYKGLKMVFTDSENATIARTELANDNHIWKVCGWHKLMTAMQVGDKGDQSTWAMYETCREYGAIIATAHEHSYERTKTLSSMQNQTVDPAWPDPKNLRVTRGSTFAFVSGIGGKSIRSQSRCLNTSEAGCNIWAGIRTSTQAGTKFGAFFITFNVGGDPRKATAYFKETDGRATDDGITITAN